MATLQPQELDFAETAPFIAEAPVVVSGTPAEVWAVLLDYPAWPRWFKGVKTCEPTSDPATGVGSTRTVTLQAGGRVDERFIAWEDEQLWAFTGLTAPGLLSALVERVTLRPVDAGRTEVTYRMAARWRGPFAVLGKGLRGSVEKNLAASLRNIDAEVAARR